MSQVLSTLKPLLCSFFKFHTTIQNTIIKKRYISVPAYIICAAIIFLPSENVYAQISGSISADSDSRFRGRSESRGQPVITGSLSYEDQNGIYGGGTITFTIGDETQGPLSYTAQIGYATKLNSKTSFDTGAIVVAYTDRYSGLANDTFVEYYTGLSYGSITGRARYSPNYQEQGLSTIYLELDTFKRIAKDFNITAHAGLLSQVGGAGSLGGRRSRHDFQIALIKDIKFWSINGAFNLGGPSGGPYFDGPWSGRRAFTFGVSRSF